MKNKLFCALVTFWEFICENSVLSDISSRCCTLGRKETNTHKPRTLRFRTLWSNFHRTIPTLCGVNPKLCCVLVFYSKQFYKFTFSSHFWVIFNHNQFIQNTTKIFGYWHHVGMAEYVLDFFHDSYKKYLTPITLCATFSISPPNC